MPLPRIFRRKERPALPGAPFFLCTIRGTKISSHRSAYGARIVGRDWQLKAPGRAFIIKDNRGRVVEELYPLRIQERKAHR